MLAFDSIKKEKKIYWYAGRWSTIHRRHGAVSLDENPDVRRGRDRVAFKKCRDEINSLAKESVSNRKICTYVTRSIFYSDGNCSIR